VSAELLTTREVADHLRLKERKVYDLVARRQIPCARIGGKWVFPRALIDAWVLARVEGERPAPARPLPAVVAGSHDPLIEWAVRESGAGLAMLVDGSLAGLDRLEARDALAAGLHVVDPESGEHNLPLVRARLGARPVVLLAWAVRGQGLIVAAGNPEGITGLADLARVRVASRQESSGSFLLLRHLLERAGLAPEIAAAGPAVHSETEIALAVREGRADTGLGIAAVARQFGLDFVPLARERYDLAVWRHAYFEPPFQRLLAFTRSAAFRERAERLAGYDVAALGTVRYNAPE